MMGSASSSALVLCLACILFAPPLRKVAGDDGAEGEGRRDVGANRWDDPDRHYQEFIRRGTSSHTDNWAVLVCTSRFWFNYRHVANTLAVYRAVKRMGMPDSNIILMLADDMACNPRNSAPGSVYASFDNNGLDLYGDDIEIDYRGYDVSVESFVRVLTGRHKPGTPPSKKLRTGPGSNVLIYMTGHGGDEFLKFQDFEEISSRDIADSFQQMWEKRRYNEILFMVDTCQAGTLSKHIYSPRIIGVGSSQKGENSYSLGNNQELGVSTSDRFTYTLLQQIENLNIGSEKRLVDIFDAFQPRFLMSTPAYALRMWRHRPLKNVLVTDFFGATMTVETGIPAHPLSGELGEEYQSSPLSSWIGGGGSHRSASADGIDLAISVPRSSLGAASGVALAAFAGLVLAGLFSGTGGSNPSSNSSWSKGKRQKMD